MIIYLAGKYTGDVDRNIADARKVAVACWEKGYATICPHLNTSHFEIDCGATYEDYMKGDMEILLRCDAIVMLPGWEDSPGARMERECAIQYGTPVYEYPELPRISGTEKDKPLQVRGFISQMMQMYRIHLSKNEDYSTANITGPGELGVIVRLWDKITRLMNLIGYKLDVASEYTGCPKSPHHEAIEDTFLDLATYGIIGKLLRDGVWGK